MHVERVLGKSIMSRTRRCRMRMMWGGGNTNLVSGGERCGIMQTIVVGDDVKG